MKATHLTSGSIEKFRDSLYVRGLSSLTVQSYCADLTGLLQWMTTSKPESDSLEVCTSIYLNDTRNLVQPKTTLRRMTSFKQYALHYGERDFLHAYKGPVPAKPKPHPLPEGIEGIRKIIRYAVGAESKALCAMMGLMGMRVSEARSISPTSFDMHDRVVTIRGKGDRSREVPMSDEAWDAIQDAFFLAIKNGTTLVTLSDSAARRAYATAGRRAGISRRTSSHDARATLATAALNNGANIRVVQEILGHASVASTEVYTGVTEQQMRDGMTFS